MFVAALTQSGHLYVFSFSLSRVENWKEISKAQKGGKILLDEAGNEKLMDLVDYQYNRKYKQLLQQYEYVPKYPTQADEKRKAREAKKKGETLQKPDPTEPKKAYTKVNLFDYFSQAEGLTFL